MPVNRAQTVVVQGLSPDGKKFTAEFRDIGARIIQHEIDHLDGILFIDRLSKHERAELKNVLKELRKKSGSKKSRYYRR